MQDKRGWIDNVGAVEIISDVLLADDSTTTTVALKNSHVGSPAVFVTPSPVGLVITKSAKTIVLTYTQVTDDTYVDIMVV